MKFQIRICTRKYLKFFHQLFSIPNLYQEMRNAKSKKVNNSPKWIWFNKRELFYITCWESLLEENSNSIIYWMLSIKGIPLLHKTLDDVHTCNHNILARKLDLSRWIFQKKKTIPYGLIDYSGFFSLFKN